MFDAKINLNLVYLDEAKSIEREDDGIYMDGSKIDSVNLSKDIKKDLLDKINSKYNIISGNDCPMGKRRSLADIIICLKNNNSNFSIKIEGKLVKFNFRFCYCDDYNYIYTAKMKGNPTIVLK